VVSGPELPSFAQFKNSYTGQEIDKSTGLYFYQSRFYDPDIGRFIQADTVIPEPADGQTFNRYTYVNNNPFKFTDPTGHVIAIVAIIGIISKVVAVAAACYAVYQAAQAFCPATVWSAFCSVLSAVAVCSGNPVLLGVSLTLTGFNMVPTAVQAAQGDQGALTNFMIQATMFCIQLYSYHQQVGAQNAAAQNATGAGSTETGEGEYLETEAHGLPSAMSSNEGGASRLEYKKYTTFSNKLENTPPTQGLKLSLNELKSVTDKSAASFLSKEGRWGPLRYVGGHLVERTSYYWNRLAPKAWEWSPDLSSCGCTSFSDPLATKMVSDVNASFGGIPEGLEIGVKDVQRTITAFGESLSFIHDTTY